MNQDDMSKRNATRQSSVLHLICLILFHPDYTVGPGITPDLLTSGNSGELLERSRAIPPVGSFTPP